MKVDEALIIIDDKTRMQIKSELPASTCTSHIVNGCQLNSVRYLFTIMYLKICNNINISIIMTWYADNSNSTKIIITILIVSWHCIVEKYTFQSARMLIEFVLNAKYYYSM